MEWIHLTQDQYLTTLWSGGTTTQMAIAPEGAVYADRDFLWRFSSARVELEHSDFTSLPDYNRLISVLDGGLEMKIGEGERFALAPLAVRAFDGGVAVESWGQCTDYNLMLRKGQAQGSVQSLRLESGSACTWTTAVPAPEAYPNCTIALYCVSGSFTLKGLTARAGEMLLCRQADDTAFFPLVSQEGAALMAAVIYTR